MKALRLLILFFVLSPAYAGDVGYEVEVILFEDTTGVYDRVENWAATEETLLQAEKDRLEENPQEQKPRRANETDYTILQTDQYRLLKEAKRLAKHPDYNVLLHTAWKQEGLDRPEAFAIPVDTHSAKQASYLEGSIMLVMSRYLHIDADMHYYKPGPDQAPSLTFTDQQAPAAMTRSPMQSYPVMFDRRMRSREIHYIDHPMVGMIVLATPFKIETEGEAGKPTKGYETL